MQEKEIEALKELADLLYSRSNCKGVLENPLDLALEVMEWYREKGATIPEPFENIEQLPEPITPEALEAEGWKECGTPNIKRYRLGRLHVVFIRTGAGASVWVGDSSTQFKGCKTMPDLRTLVRYVNGPE